MAILNAFRVHCTSTCIICAFFFSLNPASRTQLLLSAARLAQSVEHETLNLGVVGSSPTLGEYFSIFYIHLFLLCHSTLF